MTATITGNQKYGYTLELPNDGFYPKPRRLHSYRLQSLQDYVEKNLPGLSVEMDVQPPAGTDAGKSDLQ